VQAVAALTLLMTAAQERKKLREKLDLQGMEVIESPKKANTNAFVLSVIFLFLFVATFLLHFLVSDLILTWWNLASFPDSCVWAEKRAWYTLFAHAQFPQDFWEFGNFP